MKELIALLDRQTQVGTAGARRRRVAQPGAPLPRPPQRAGPRRHLLRERAVDRCQQPHALRLLERDPRQRQAAASRAAGPRRRGHRRRQAGRGHQAVRRRGARRQRETVGECSSSSRPPTGPTPPTRRWASLLERALQKAGDAERPHRALRAAPLDGTTDSADLLQLLLRIGELYETRLGDLAAALAGLRGGARVGARPLPRPLGQSPLRHPAGEQRPRANRPRGRGPDAPESTSATQALLDAAQLAREAGTRRVGAPQALYRRVLDREPLHPEAGPALEELLAKRGGAEDLVALHEKRGEPSWPRRIPPPPPPSTSRRPAGVIEALKDRPRAMALLDQALMAMPTHLEALELKGALAVEAQHYGRPQPPGRCGCSRAATPRSSPA